VETNNKLIILLKGYFI